MKPDQTSLGEDPYRFRTTRWSLVLLSAQSQAPGFEAALGELYRIYWYPLYAYVRRRGHAPEETQDLTQGFFLHLLEHKTLARADPLKGRFRSFLLGSLQNYLSTEVDRARCLKRGGKVEFVPLDVQDAEERYRSEPIDALTPEKIFAARWAMALLGEAMNHLRQEYVTRRNTATFEALKAFLDVTDSKEPPSYEQAAAALKVSVGAVKTLIHRLRKQYTALVREEIARTISNPADAAVEMHELCEALMVTEGWIESSFEATVKPTPQKSTQRFEHYELLTGEYGKPVELGRGAMGVTYKAVDVDLLCPVTLKVISERYLGDESARLRFLREARAAAKVRHSNVASVFHLGRTGGNYFYAMEFVEGETLEHLIKRSGQLKVKLALEIVMQVAAGLAAVHEQNLVHRDIKPSNIMVRLKDDDSITAKIIDLGLAKRLDESASEAGISSPGAFAGTPEFASPEQFTGVGVDIRSDLYSLGVTLWVMVTGQTPFRGTPAEVMYQHQHAPLPLERLKDVPQPVVVLFEKLLEKDPAQRFGTPSEFLQAIPKITGAIDARRRITRQSLQKTPSTASRTGTSKPPEKPGPEKISVARLPVTGSDLFGREEDIAFLDRAWANKDVNVVTIVAWAGVGKSTLVNHWLRRMAANIIVLRS